MSSQVTALGAGMPNSMYTLNHFISIDDPNLLLMGRADRTQTGTLRIGYPGVTIRVGFTGTSLGIRAQCTSPSCYLSVVADADGERMVHLSEGEVSTQLVGGLGPGDHQIDVIRRTEYWQGLLTVQGFLLDRGAKTVAAKPFPSRRLMVIGDSVSCGEGVDRPPTGASRSNAASSNAFGSYGMRLARALNAQCHLVCFGGRGLVRDWQGKRDILNAPQFFELAIPEEQPRVLWDHASYIPDGIIVSLGTNDFNLALGAFPTEDDFVGIYVTFLRRVRALYPKAQIFLTEGAIVNHQGADPKRILFGYVQSTVARLGDPQILAVASRHYPGDAQNAHPTGEQHQMMARDLEPILRAQLGW